MTPRIPLLLLALALPFASHAQAQPLPAPAPAPNPARFHADPGHDGFTMRLEKMLRNSREKRQRVVLRIHGEEVAGVVQDLGPGWVVMSNQEDQEILLQTRFVERAELR